MTPTFHGEVMLLGWSESHNSGAKVTFQLSDASDLEPFKSMTIRKGKIAGQRLACVLIEIGDDEKPVEQPEPEPIKGGALAKLAGMWCQDQRFRDWVGAKNEEEARQFILCECRIGSRRELDNNAMAAHIFHNVIREPFAEHLRGVAA